MSFVVDTDICSVYLKGDGHLFNRFIQHTGGIFISTVTVVELYSWAHRTAQSAQRLDAVANLLSDAELLDIDLTVAHRAGEVRAAMLDCGLVIALPDLMIAATALVHDFTMVTHNTRHFAMVPGLRIEDWLAP